jgi:hypothetical protein
MQNDVYEKTPLDDHNDAEILQEIKNARGIDPGLHINDQALYTLL